MGASFVRGLKSGGGANIGGLKSFVRGLKSGGGANICGLESGAGQASGEDGKVGTSIYN